MSQGPVLFAYDGSTHARAAIEHAGGVLQAGPAIVATAWTSFEDAAPSALLALPGDMVRGSVDTLDEANREAAEELAAQGAELARAAGFDAEPRAVRRARPFPDGHKEVVALGTRIRSPATGGIRGELRGGVRLFKPSPPRR